MPYKNRKSPSSIKNYIYGLMTDLGLNKIASPSSVATRQNGRNLPFALTAPSGGCIRKYQFEQAQLLISLICTIVG